MQQSNNEEESYLNQTQSIQEYEQQINEIRSSQQLSPSFRTSNYIYSITEDYKAKGNKVEQIQSKREDFLQNKQENEMKLDGEQQQNLYINRSQVQTLNNSIDKLFSCCTTDDYQDMTKYVIFKDFQSDSKANSKYGSKRESKQQTPSITPRFNFYPADQLLQIQNTYFLEKPVKNSSSYQSQESFCFKENKYANSSTNQYSFNNQDINPFDHFYQVKANQHLDGQEQGLIDHQGNTLHPYIINQKNGLQNIEKQQQLNSYHLPQQKKKKTIINSDLYQNGTLKNNQSQQNNRQQNGENSTENNKQHSMSAMMSQVQTYQKQPRLNKLKEVYNGKNTYNNANLRVCETEPAYVDNGDESEQYIQDYKNNILNPENSNSSWREFDAQNDTAENRRKQQQFIINEIQQLGNHTGKNKNSKNKYLIENQQENLEQNQIKENSYYNEEEFQDVEQIRQNMRNKQIKHMQTKNPNYNNFLNQKFQQNQASKLRQLGAGQQQFSAKQNVFDPLQIDHHHRIIKRINTNPNGIGSTGSTQIRVGSGDSRQINKIQQQNMQKNQFMSNIENINNKFISNGNNGFNLNENNAQNNQQRKFRQLSAHTYNNGNNLNEQNLENKNNHIIDEEYNNDSFMNLSNVSNEINTTLPEGINQLNKQQFKYSQEYIQNNNIQQLHSTSSTKRQNFKNQYDENNQEKLMIKKKIQDFEKKKNINLNIQPNTNIAKLISKPQVTNTQSATAAATAAAIAAAQQAKKNSSQSLKKRNKSRSQSQGKPLDNIMEVSQKLENSSLVHQNFCSGQYDQKCDNISDKKKLQSIHNYNSNQTNVNSDASQNQNTSSSRNVSSDFDTYNVPKFICKTEGDDSSNSFQISSNIEQDQKDQDNYQLISSVSSINKFGNTLSNQLHDNQQIQTKNAHSKLLLKSGKRIQSAHSNQNNGSSGLNNPFNYQLTANLINQSNSLIGNLPGCSPQQLLQIQGGQQRGRFNSYHNSSSQQSNNLSINSNQNLSKKLNALPQSNTSSKIQSNSIANTLLKNQLKKRSYTPLLNASNQNQMQLGQLKDHFFLNQNEQTPLNDINGNIKKITRNQKIFSAHSQSEKDQMNLSGQIPFVQPLSPLQYQQLTLNNSLQQTQTHTFPNLQKQLIKRNEIGGVNSNQINQQNQQYQPLQRSSSRQGQNQSLITNQQWQQQKMKSMVNSNNNSILNQTLSSKLNKL